MPSRPFVVLGVLVALFAAAACRGGEKRADERPLLDERGFASVVAGAVRTQTGLAAEPTFGLTVHVSREENWVDLDLEDAYARYRREPERRDEIAQSIARRAEQRIERGIDGTSWADVRRGLMPMLKRRSQLADLSGRPASRRFLKELVIVYAVDRKVEFTLVTAADLERWGKSVDEVDAIARANLARATEDLLCEQQLCGWASGDGYDATRMIVPELRREIVAEIGPAVYAVPMEHVFVALPIEFAERIRSKVLRDFTTADNPVSPNLFVERDGKLAVLEQ